MHSHMRVCKAATKWPAPFNVNRASGCGECRSRATTRGPRIMFTHASTPHSVRNRVMLCLRAQHAAFMHSRHVPQTPRPPMRVRRQARWKTRSADTRSARAGTSIRRVDPWFKSELGASFNRLRPRRVCVFVRERCPQCPSAWPNGDLRSIGRTNARRRLSRMNASQRL